MTSFRLRAAGALGLVLSPFMGNLFPLAAPHVRAETPAPPCTWSRSPSIRLPLQIDEKTRAKIREIKLYVKAPGADWAVNQAGPPTQSRFDYHAGKDGVYSFMFVSVDKTGQSFPRSMEARPPHQLIVVDTTPPELTVMPMPVANRDIYLQVRMEDANPDRSSIKLEYSVGENAWHAMDLAQADSPGVFRIPHASVLEGKVRATAKDKAGNVAQRIVDLGDPTTSFVSQRPQQSSDVVKAEPPVAATPDASAPAAGQATRQTSAKPADPFEMKLPEPEPQKSQSAYNPNRPNAAATVKVPDAAPVIVDPQAANDHNVLPVNLARASTPAPSDPSNLVQVPTPPSDPYFPPQPQPTTSERRTNEPEPRRLEPPVVEARPAVELIEISIPEVPPARSPITTTSSQAVSSAPTVPNAPAVSSAATPSSVPSAKGSIEIINAPRCTLDYAVENVIGGGQPKMEFWATPDNGRTWERVPDESVGRSPAKLVLPGDGVFGIRVRANGNGQPPHAGEAPDAWVEVDATRPIVHVSPPTLGSGVDAGTLTIQWTAHDKNLVADSISIYQASRPDGQWLPIASGLRNEGSFRWLVPQGIGSDIYLRVEAADRAGNIGFGELRDPVSLPQPRVRVIGIGPAR